jgi:hypothetical protein
MVGWSTGPPAVETAREGIQSQLTPYTVLRNLAPYTDHMNVMMKKKYLMAFMKVRLFNNMAIIKSIDSGINNIRC